VKYKVKKSDIPSEEHTVYLLTDENGVASS
jgi:hypothetical protein